MFKLPPASTLTLFLFLFFNLSCTDEKPITSSKIQVTAHNELGEYFADVPIFITLALGSESIETILWDFGDNSTSSDVSPYHSFPEGFNRISVTATTSSRGIVADTTINIVAGPMVYGAENSGEYGLFTFEDDKGGYGLLYESSNGSNKFDNFLLRVNEEFQLVKTTQINQNADHIGPIVQTNTGNLAVPFDNNLVVLNSDGETLHNQHLGIQFNNIYFINAAGTSDNDLVYHYYWNSNLVSQKINFQDFTTVNNSTDISTSGYEVRSIFDSGNSTYLCYYSDALHSTNKELLTYRNFNGDIIFSKEFSNELYLKDAVRITHGWIVSSTEEANTNRIVLVKLDDQGIIKWKKVFPISNKTNISNSFGSSKTIEFDGFLYVFFDNMRSLKLEEATGNIVWDKYFDLPNSIWGHTMLTKRGTFIMIGSRLIRPELGQNMNDLILLEITKDGIRI